MSSAVRRSVANWLCDASALRWVAGAATTTPQLARCRSSSSYRDVGCSQPWPNAIAASPRPDRGVNTTPGMPAAVRSPLATAYGPGRDSSSAARRTAGSVRAMGRDGIGLTDLIRL